MAMYVEQVSISCAIGKPNGFKMFNELKISLGLLVFIIVLCLNNVSTEPVPRPRGVSLTNEPFYRDKNYFTCLDGSRTISKRQVNDDYCDCSDSSDEPGTSACPKGKFHCNNKGHRPAYLPSSWVNDGICDCCDASDEYEGEGVVKCVNNCLELGRAELQRRHQEIILMNQGYEIRQKYIKEGTEQKVEREETLKKLLEEKGTVEQDKEEKQKLKEIAEAPEKEAKDAHKALWDAQQEVLRVEREKQRASDAFDEFDVNGDGHVSVDELKDHKEFDTDENGDVSYDDAKIVLGNVDAVTRDTFTGPVWDSIKDKFKSEKQIPPPPVDEGTPKEGIDASDEDRDVGDDGDFHDDEDDEEDDEDEEDDDDEDGNTEELMAKYGKHRAKMERKKAMEDKDGNEMTEYEPETKILIEVADAARQVFKEAENRVNDVKRSFEDLEKLLRVDLGTHQEFEPLQKQCYEYTDREYIYKLCPFDRVTQRSKSGGSDTLLGTWGKWEGPAENTYSKMKYSNGRNCWNGPDRSSLVNVRCGTENRVLSATEPERCVYQLEFETPAMCTTKVDPQTGETDSHDEL